MEARQLLPPLRAISRREWAVLLAGTGVQAQPPVPWVCPMDPDVRSHKPDRCRKCGMQLVAGIPVPEEVPVEMTVTPPAPRPGEKFALRFRIAPKLQIVHEKLFHLFLVSRDLSVFRHEHPRMQPDGTLLYRALLPKGGMYRVLCDFYPEGGTLQMVPKTIFLRGSASLPQPKLASNLRVSLKTDPGQALAGKKTMLFFTLEPGDGLEPYLGAWGHLLAASADLIDMVHAHPAWEEGGPTVQFNLIFPRPGVHRVWVQFQRLGMVNTAWFDIPVAEI